MVQGLCIKTPTLEALRTANLSVYDQAIVSAIFNLLPQGIPPGGVSYDLLARPEKYGHSYVQLAYLYEAEKLPLFQIVPLCTSLIPRHIPIDTKILCHHVLGMKGNGSKLKISEKKFDYWRTAFNLRHHLFKKRSGMSFAGFVRTDGISISIVIEKPEVKRKKRKRNHIIRQQSEYFQDHIPKLKNEKVFIDPNRRDLLYCLGSNTEKLRYTSMQRRSETKAKEHERIRTKIEVAAALRGPIIRQGRRNIRVPSANLPSKYTVNQEHFQGYLAYFFYAMTKREDVYSKEVFRKLKFAK